MNYKDEEGNILKGFSQTDLDELAKEQKKTRKLLKLYGGLALLLGYSIFIAAMYILFLFMKYHILTDIIRSCVG